MCPCHCLLSLMHSKGADIHHLDRASMRSQHHIRPKPTGRLYDAKSCEFESDSELTSKALIPAPMQAYSRSSWEQMPISPLLLSSPKQEMNCKHSGTQQLIVIGHNSSSLCLAKTLVSKRAQLSTQDCRLFCLCSLTEHSWPRTSF